MQKKFASNLKPVKLSMPTLRQKSVDLWTPQPSRMLLDRHGEYLGEVPALEDGLGYWPVRRRACQVASSAAV